MDGINGFTFDGQHVSWVEGYSATLSYQKDALPEIKNYTTEIKRRDGFIDGGRSKSGKTFKATFAIEGEDITDLHQKIDNVVEWLDTPDVRSLAFDAFPYVNYMARISRGLEPKITGLYAVFEIEFMSPYAYGTGQPIQELVTDSLHMFTRLGNEEVPPVLEFDVNADVENIEFKLYKSSSAYQPENLTELYIFKINKSFVIGDKIIIDMGKRTVLANDVDIRNVLDISSRYFKLPKYYAFSLPDGVALSISYTERWK